MTTRPSDQDLRTMEDILDFARVAERLVARGRRAYERDEMLPLAAEAILHRVGEAVSRLPEGFVTAHPQVRWRLMKGMRNLIAHECQVVDSSIVWNTLAHELPVDAASIRAILDAADTGT
ncbi:MAG: DUF86 domain-containing protein [Actinobacteria bacterium]|nr:DUF86 domain-containing protein [Actinomycetota bacterium]HRY08972.1 DUF86 domain-containing protein [Candidatus Nanopelagicales bacterium]